MARTRQIKPGFFKNESLAPHCSPWARLLWIGLWQQADREGRLEYRPMRLKAEIFPFDNVDIETMIFELETQGFLVRYKVGASPVLLYLFNFKKHQHINVKENASEWPEYKEEFALSAKAPDLFGARTVPARPYTLDLIPNTLNLKPQDDPPEHTGLPLKTVFLDNGSQEGQGADAQGAGFDQLVRDLGKPIENGLMEQIEDRTVVSITHAPYGVDGQIQEHNSSTADILGHNNVSRETPLSQASGDELAKLYEAIAAKGTGKKKATRLSDQFPKCVTPEDFANNLPATWQAVLDRFIDDGEYGFKRVFALNFWEQYVGHYPGADIAERFPEKENWFKTFETKAENHARKAQGLPPLHIDGSKSMEARRKRLGLS